MAQFTLAERLCMAFSAADASGAQLCLTGGAMPRSRKASQSLVVAEAQARGAAARGSRSLAKAHGGGSRPVAFSGLDLSPIFVHSSFRTSSTWFWSKLRATPHVTAYYEIFNEWLAQLSVKGLSHIDHALWNSRHPPGAPYFLEFMPLLQEGGGTAGYSLDMAMDRFIPAGGVNGDLSGAERAYVGSLIANAHRNWKIPVLADTRTLGRARALRKAFGGRVVFCYRNLFHQWASYAGQAIDGNPFFLSTVDACLKASRHDPFLAAVDEWTAGRTVSPHDEMLFQAFLLLHLYVSVLTFQESDLLVDVTGIAGNTQLRQDVEAELSRMVGAPVDLSDVRETFDVSPLAVTSTVALADTIDQFTKMIHAYCQNAGAKSFVDSMKDSALAELERHEFFVQSARRVHAAQLVQAEQRATEESQRGDAASAEREALAGQLSGALVEAADLRQAQESLQQELHRQLHELAEHQAAQAAALAALTMQLDAAQDERAAQAERAATAEAASSAHLDRAVSAETERDHLAEAIRAAEAEGIQLLTREAMLVTERNEIAQRFALAEAELSALRDRATEAESGRDHLASALRTAEADLAALRTREAALTFERDAAAHRAATIEAECAALRDRVSEAESERDHLASILQVAEAEIASLRAREAALAAERDDAAYRAQTVGAECAALQDRAVAAEAGRESLSSALEAAEAELASLGVRNAALEAERDRAIHRAASADAECAVLRDRSVEAEAACADAASALQTAEAEIAALRDRESALGSELDQATQSAAMAESQCSALQDRFAQAEAAREQLAAALQITEAERASLREREITLLEARDQSARLAAFADVQCAALRERVAEVEAAREQLAAALRDAEARAAALQDRQAALAAEREALEQCLASASQSISLTDRLSQLRRRLG